MNKVYLKMKGSIRFFAFMALGLTIIIIDRSAGFSFTGEAIPCKGIQVHGYPKMKEQYERCTKKVTEGYKKRNETVQGFDGVLCTAMCGFLEDKLVDEKTGHLIKSGLDNYKDMFEHIPKEVRKEITGAFYNCFEQHKNDTVYNAKKVTDCSGILGVGACIKLGIDAVCNADEN